MKNMRIGHVGLKNVMQAAGLKKSYRNNGHKRNLVMSVLALFVLSNGLQASAAAQMPGTAGGAYGCSCKEILKPPSADRADNIEKGLEFSHTAEYTKQFETAIAQARAAAEAHKGEKNVAIVSDIDETLFDNRPYYEKHTKDFNWEDFFVWMKEGDSPLLQKTADLLSWARDNGYAVFLVTGRHEDARVGTTESLVRRKVAYDGLYMRKVGDNRRAEDFKSEVRNNLEQSGFKIIVNIGDQVSDLYGGHAEQCVKLPNEMYYIP
jgi:hypothetical protein